MSAFEAAALSLHVLDYQACSTPEINGYQHQPVPERAALEPSEPHSRWCLQSVVRNLEVFVLSRRDPVATAAVISSRVRTRFEFAPFVGCRQKRDVPDRFLARNRFFNLLMTKRMRRGCLIHGNGGNYWAISVT